jgi:hypothetical protein
MILRRLGIGKKSEYFLEAKPDASGDAKKPEAKAPEAKKPEAKAPEPKQEAQPEAKAAAPIDPKAVEAALAVEGTTNGAAPAPAPAPAPPAKQKKMKQAKAPAPVAPAPAAVVPAPKPVVAKPATANFATEYLLPSGTPRRRPGPSLDGFKTMARQVSPRR